MVKTVTGSLKYLNLNTITQHKTLSMNNSFEDLDKLGMYLGGLLGRMLNTQVL